MPIITVIKCIRNTATAAAVSIHSTDSSHFYRRHNQNPLPSLQKWQYLPPQPVTRQQQKPMQKSHSSHFRAAATAVSLLATSQAQNLT